MMTDKKELELYVHIPFCVRKCAYCDFLSGPAGEAEKAAYVDALLTEIRSRKENYKDYRVSTVFLGGGTPSILEGEDAARIFHTIRESFEVSPDAEITMEVNPGTVTREKAEAWKRAGVTRLSIGLQSVNDRELKMLGRIHTYSEFVRTWELVRRTGFDNVNIDLISAIPGQTQESWEKTLRTVAELGPEHLSAYSLIVEEGTLFYERYGGENGPADAGNPALISLPALPDEDTEREIYRMTERILREYGYHRYEISNYARKGYECRHNLGYWERVEYLGLGLGASSLVSALTGEFRFHNTSDMEKYRKFFGRKYENAEKDMQTETGGETGGSPESPQEDIRKKAGPAAEEVEELDANDRMEEFMFLGLRKMAGISCEAFRRKFGKPIEEVYGHQIARFTELGLMEREGGRLRLTEKGIDVSDSVFVEFML